MEVRRLVEMVWGGEALSLVEMTWVEKMDDFCAGRLAGRGEFP
jgi:hypothetical protein